jgi:integration host factor subunit beta
LTRSELVERIAAKMGNMTFSLTMKNIDDIVSVFFDKITKTLASGDRVEIRGFGAFSVRQRKPRVAINPKNKNKVQIPSKNIVHFKTGKELHNRLNEKN